MTRTSSPHPVRSTGIRVAGALTSAVAVAFAGVAVLPPATAAAAGVTDDRPHPPSRHPRGPSALPRDTTTQVVATYRWADGRWVPV
ncbi:hypothetical protein [Phycicoccus sonneratiae]|uniref:Uncharacterized protein n=1 Tax=Phycicoccus sonneratiae TaxID=2807628 RepID=A0ABS2CN50_9MICO|nr:hypothetical protein [Phycicoccus sonneraticus]MBM6401309.1 hypothetical protein [Phycicoccus sonneraticus]